MKKIYLKEIRQIVANFANMNSPTGYSSNGNQTILRVIGNMIKWNWIESVDEDERLISVIPTDDLITKISGNYAKSNCLRFPVYIKALKNIFKGKF